VHRIDRQAWIHRENLPLSMKVRDARDWHDPWDKRDPQEQANARKSKRTPARAGERPQEQVTRKNKRTPARTSKRPQEQANARKNKRTPARAGERPQEQANARKSNANARRGVAI
jgi:hypothetical protein